MIRKSTVFVIGAGASKEVGLPMGTELKGKIASSVSIGYHSGYQQTSGDRNIAQAVSHHVKASGGV